MAGVCFFPPVVDFLAAETLPTDCDFCGVSFLEDGLLGVYFKTLSTFFLTSADSAAFLPATFFSLAADFDAAFFLPLAPPLTFGCPAAA